MAMTANTWYEITLAALADPPYPASLAYSLHPFVVNAILTGAAARVFCLSDAGPGGTALISFVGGTGMVPSDAVTIVSTPAMDTSVITGTGETWYSVREAFGPGWFWYGDQSGTVNYMTDSTTLGAFIA